MYFKSWPLFNVTLVSLSLDSFFAQYDKAPRYLNRPHDWYDDFLLVAESDGSRIEAFDHKIKGNLVVLYIQV